MQKNKNRIKNSFIKLRALLLIIAAVSLVGSSISVYADQYDAQINVLRDQNSNTQGQVNQLQLEATSFQDAITKLQDEINVLQAALYANQAKQVELQAQIEVAKAKIAQQKVYLGEGIKAMYVEGDLSTIEQLASSNNLSDFIDKEEYRTSVQNKVDGIIKEISALQTTMQSQKLEVDALVQNQKKQNDTLASTQSQQQSMLSYNEGQQNAFNSQISGNNAKIAKLKQQQAAELIRSYGNSGGRARGTGSYPWSNATCIHNGSSRGYCSNYDWAIGGNIYNPETSYGYRNCTDWVAWKTGAPRGLGNANQWADRSGNVSSSPDQGDAAVDESGYYGHVMYVESVDGNTITVSDYNRAGTGEYDVMQLTRVGEGRYQTPTGYVRTLKFVTF